MTDINIEKFKKDGFTFEEIESIISSINNFNKTGITHTHESVKNNARKEIFSKVSINV